MINERETRLSTINAELKARHLKPLRKLGDKTEGEIEVVRIIEIFEHSKTYFTDVKFAVLLPNNNEREFTVRFNANGEVSDGAAVVTIVNGKFAIVKQWRLPLCQWTYEVPRGFGDKLDKAKSQGSLDALTLADLPLGILTRELGDAIMTNARILAVTHLGNIAENSGTSAVQPNYFLARIEVDEALLQAKLKGSNDLKVYFWTEEEVNEQIGNKLADNHSIVALSLATRQIAREKKAV